LELAKAPELIAPVADAAQPAGLQVRALKALLSLKAPQSRPVCEAGIKSTHPSVRGAAASGLGVLASPDSGKLLLPLLDDLDTAVQVAAIQSLGTLKERQAFPALLKLSEREVTQFEAIAALAKMPDVKAFNAYVAGLGSRNLELRNSCKQA